VETCAEAGGARTGELVVRPVADEQRAARRYLKFPAREKVDPGVGLGEADGT